MPQCIIKSYNQFQPIPDRGAEFFDGLLGAIDYKLWCCGHFHIDGIKTAHKLCMFYKKYEISKKSLFEKGKIICLNIF